ncbi:MAG: hypothetical protein L3K05_04255, partial [Thermoplasmata archaeon]|nr:hypothetical protein [Thermoplasmata archaeon]
IPGTITPQTILMHIWDYESVTLLLYVLKVKVVNATAAAGPNIAPPSWTSLANGVIALGAVGIGLAVVLVARREPPTPPGVSGPTATSRSSSSPASGGGPPSELRTKRP